MNVSVPVSFLGTLVNTDSARVWPEARGSACLAPQVSWRCWSTEHTGQWGTRELLADTGEPGAPTAAATDDKSVCLSFKLRHRGERAANSPGVLAEVGDQLLSRCPPALCGGLLQLHGSLHQATAGTSRGRGAATEHREGGISQVSQRASWDQELAQVHSHPRCKGHLQVRSYETVIFTPADSRNGCEVPEFSRS